MSTSQRPGRVREPPPTTASEGDDGYLTASEIATPKLDADWVILSACNTAAGGAQGAEAVRKPETREKRMQAIIEMLARGEKFH